MNERCVDRQNYDVASISRKGKKRANHIQHALFIDHDKIKIPGKFINLFTNMFLKKEAGRKAFC